MVMAQPLAPLGVMGVLPGRLGFAKGSDLMVEVGLLLRMALPNSWICFCARRALAICFRLPLSTVAQPSTSSNALRSMSGNDAPLAGKRAR